jgi:hypothetical protein
MQTRVLIADVCAVHPGFKISGTGLVGHTQLCRHDCHVLGAFPMFRPETKQALLIGLGGGHVARDLRLIEHEYRINDTDAHVLFW